MTDPQHHEGHSGHGGICTVAIGTIIAVHTS